MIKIALTSAVAAAAAVSTAGAVQIRIDITSNAPTGGVALTPVWLGFHDGSFNNFTPGGTASAGLESIAEDGAVAARNAEFGMSGVTGVVGSPSGPPPLLPGESGSITLTLANDGSNNFLSYASMVLVSNDFFVGNSSALDISSVLSGGGPFTFNIGGTVWDAGTEANDFATSAANPLFGFAGGQSGPNEGDSDPTETGITAVTGDPFAGFDNIANAPGGAVPAEFDFTTYQNGIATVTITQVPEPGTGLLAALGVLGFIARRRRK